jgi:hypothetical protein
MTSCHLFLEAREGKGLASSMSGAQQAELHKLGSWVEQKGVGQRTMLHCIIQRSNDVLKGWAAENGHD